MLPKGCTSFQSNGRHTNKSIPSSSCPNNFLWWVCSIRIKWKSRFLTLRMRPLEMWMPIRQVIQLYCSGSMKTIPLWASAILKSRQTLFLRGANSNLDRSPGRKRSATTSPKEINPCLTDPKIFLICPLLEWNQWTFDIYDLLLLNLKINTENNESTLI